MLTIMYRISPDRRLCPAPSLSVISYMPDPDKSFPSVDLVIAGPFASRTLYICPVFQFSIMPVN